MHNEVFVWVAAWYASGVALFIWLSRWRFSSGFSVEDWPIALTFGGLSGLLSLFVLLGKEK
jgi:hypothetical protein